METKDIKDITEECSKLKIGEKINFKSPRRFRDIELQFLTFLIALERRSAPGSILLRREKKHYTAECKAD